MIERRLRAVAVVTCIAALTVARRDARAQGPKAQADVLFRDGERLFQEGEIAAACEKFAESQRLDPGLGTLINLGLCHERQGKSATAIAELRDALAQATQRGESDRVRLLRDEIAKLEARLSKVELVAPAAPPSVVMDGRSLDATSLSAPFAVDPGTHTFVLSAPKKRTATLTITVGDGPVTQTVRLPPLEDETTGAPADDATRAAGRRQRILGLATLGLGAVGLGVGTIFGLKAISEQSTVERECVSGVVECASREGVDASELAHTYATISTVSFGVGIVAGVAGAVLFFTAPKSAAARIQVVPRVGTRDAGLGVRAAW